MDLKQRTTQKVLQRQRESREGDKNLELQECPGFIIFFNLKLQIFLFKSKIFKKYPNLIKKKNDRKLVA